MCANCYEEYGKSTHPPLSIRAVGLYELDGDWKYSQLSQEIWDLKRGDSNAAERIGECMVYVLNNKYIDLKNMDLLIPIPSSDISRSYNQALMLAQYISSRIGTEIQDVLYFIEPHKPQHTTSWRDKENNIRGKIGCRKRVDGRKILLVDDTYITGSTSKECARILRDMGAVEVNGLMAGRSIDKSHKALVEEDA